MRRTLIGIFALSCVSSVPASAWENPKCANNMDGSFVCYVSMKVDFSDEYRKQEIGIGVLSGKNGSTLPVIIIFDNDWGMRNRAGVDTRIRVDGLPFVNRESATQGSYVFIKLMSDDLQHISDGRDLYVIFPAFSARYSLDGSRAAIKSLFAALESYTLSHDSFADNDVAKSDPFASRNQ